MSIKRLYKDVFEKVEFLDKNFDNPFLKEKQDSNPFAKFYGGTYVWIEEEKTDKIE